ncbi:MAG: GAF domain-containing sensor histidine kinase [Leptolyngbyaceae cyanobacterium MO_188.B28]|nr:GAF domain-containing sensor histidine kinase [Leptolyngbyaceae cyanobacterium MO_188.B28]
MNYGACHVTASEIPLTRAERHLACRLDDSTPSKRAQDRLQVMETLGLYDSENATLFEEAAQTACQFLAAPIGILSILTQEHEVFKATVGLSRLGLMNKLATSRRLPLQESFGVHVVDSEQVFSLKNAVQHPACSCSILVQHYGVRSYLGVPLRTTDGYCVGILAVMDLIPREFTPQDITFLELNARWCMSEIERCRLSQSHQIATPPQSYQLNVSGSQANSPNTALEETIKSVRANLISQLTQELRNPLTSIMGMASMLSREIYGPLTEKQKEYAEIVRGSSQTLLSLVDEIIDLGGLHTLGKTLNLAPVDIEMLGQQAFKMLDKVAQQRKQTINLTVEPGSRIWMLDKGKVKQLMHHLVLSIIRLSSEGSAIRIHVSRKEERLSMAVWASHPWLGEGLPPAVLSFSKLLSSPSGMVDLDFYENIVKLSTPGNDFSQGISDTDNLSGMPTVSSSSHSSVSREGLGLLLSRQLAEMHQGIINIQGSHERGYRYIVSLPQLAGQETPLPMAN